MLYTAITDEDEVKQALEELKDAFQAGAEQNGESYGEHRYVHRNKDGLWGAIGRQKNPRKRDKHFIGFGRGGSMVFEASPSREGDHGGQSGGLFVKDDGGNRYLTYSGNLRISAESPRSKENVRDQLMDFTGPDCWIDVTGIGSKRFLVAPLDPGNASALIDRIDRVTKVIESFKKGDDVCPLSLDGVTTEDPSTRMASSALNTILYGPPGTGKTYATFRRCVEICDGKENCPDENSKGRVRYKELVGEGRIEFVTFHQSYGYEEFVEGLRPDTGSAKEGGEVGAGFRLVATPGVLKRIAKRARGASRKMFKMSLGRSKTDEYQEIFDECIRNGYVLLGHGGKVDWSDVRFEDNNEIRKHWQERPDLGDDNSNTPSIERFRNNMSQGDLVIVPAEGLRFRAIGKVVGSYEFVPRESGYYYHRRKVRWLWSDTEGAPASDICTGRLARRTIYQFERDKIIDDGLRRYIGKAEASADAKPHVLVIDEINRANVSKVMGELITLLEEDKREGAENEVAVTLPHSGDRFTLPANLYLLGTMNTADRSIALLDTALRRRFEFEELAPEPKLLRTVDGIDLPAVLRAINQRLEYLIDRDHLIGHAWLMGARTKADVGRIMRHKIIPLIAEYFYDDWQKVRAVLGGTDDFVRGESLDRPPGLDDTDAGEDRRRWAVQKDFAEGAYDRLISGRARDSGQARSPEQAQGSGQARSPEQAQGSGQASDTEPGTD